MEHDQEPRTRQIEKFAESFTGIPFIRECVYRGLTFLSKTLEKEVSDLVIAHKGKAVVVQMKNQENPDARAPEKLPMWVRKNTMAAAKQMTGALRQITDERTWCDHPRRGRVEFEPGSLKPIHALVLIECGDARVELPGDAPNEIRGVPVSYLDTNDFFNVADQLRTFCDLERYLTERMGLGSDVRRFIGRERPVLEHYALHGGSLTQWTTYDEEQARSEREGTERKEAFLSKQKKDIAATFAEHVADALATRSPTYADGLDPQTRACFDADEGRRQYLTLQDSVSDLSLADRRMLGNAMLEMFLPADGRPRFTYRAMWFDEKPDFAYVLISAHKIERPELLVRGQVLLTAALAQLGFSGGLAIVDRDSQSFEIVYAQDFVAGAEDRERGARFFGTLRVANVLTNLMGDVRVV